MFRFSSPPPSLGRGGSRRGGPAAAAVARSREHFKASLARRLEEVYRLPLNSQASPSLRRQLGRGGGCFEVRMLAIFKEMSLGWPEMWPNPIHIFPLFFPIIYKENLIL